MRKAIAVDRIEADNAMTLMLGSLVLCLANLVLVLAQPAFAQALLLSAI